VFPIRLPTLSAALARRGKKTRAAAGVVPGDSTLCEPEGKRRGERKRSVTTHPPSAVQEEQDCRIVPLVGRGGGKKKASSPQSMDGVHRIRRYGPVTTCVQKRLLLVPTHTSWVYGKRGGFLCKGGESFSYGHPKGDAGIVCPSFILHNSRRVVA